MITSAFSFRTEETLVTGQFTRRVEQRLFHLSQHLIMVHTRNSSIDQYNAVCHKLIKTYPNVKR